ncbi:MAG: FtsX-like permease family protein [Candidatus Melainabacteria bacterium]|nr:FtsX-like permease family protein [Candidatus Melainabacteria bacterium]
MNLSVRKIRMAYRMLYETLQDLWRSGWSNWVVISILTSVLAICGFVLQISFSLNIIGQKLTDQLEFSVYLSDNVELKEFALAIGKMPYVKRVEVIDKDVAWYEFKKNFTIAEDFQNPLPNTVHVRVATPEYLKSTILAVKKIPGVIDINYAPGVLGFINKLKAFFQIVGSLLIVLLAFVTVVITGNTIQLVIHSRQNEIEVLRLMGVEDWYIKGPLIFQGIFYAVVSATFAIAPLYVLQTFLWDTAQNLIGSALPTGLPEYYAGNIFQIYYILLIIGIIVTGSGCLWSSKKYLKV